MLSVSAGAAMATWAMAIRRRANDFIFLVKWEVRKLWSERCILVSDVNEDGFVDFEFGLNCSLVRTYLLSNSWLLEKELMKPVTLPKAFLVTLKSTYFTLLGGVLVCPADSYCQSWARSMCTRS